MDKLEKLTPLKLLEDCAVLAKKYASGLVGKLATATVEAIEEVHGKIPTKVSQLNNDANYIKDLTDEEYQELNSLLEAEK